MYTIVTGDADHDEEQFPGVIARNAAT